LSIGKEVPFKTLLITGVLTLMPLVSKPKGVLVIVLKLESFPIDLNSLKLNGRVNNTDKFVSKENPKEVWEFPLAATIKRISSAFWDKISKYQSNWRPLICLLLWQWDSAIPSELSVRIECPRLSGCQNAKAGQEAKHILNPLHRQQLQMFYKGNVMTFLHPSQPADRGK